MHQEFKLNQKSFDKMEQEVLKEVMQTSKDILETFKFNLIYTLDVDKTTKDKTTKGLKEFRKKNWDSTISRNEAYKKYMKLY